MSGPAVEPGRGIAGRISSGQGAQARPPAPKPSENRWLGAVTTNQPPWRAPDAPRQADARGPGCARERCWPGPARSCRRPEGGSRRSRTSSSRRCRRAGRGRWPSGPGPGRAPPAWGASPPRTGRRRSPGRARDAHEGRVGGSRSTPLPGPVPGTAALVRGADASGPGQFVSLAGAGEPHSGRDRREGLAGRNEAIHPEDRADLLRRSGESLRARARLWQSPAPAPRCRAAARAPPCRCGGSAPEYRGGPSPPPACRRACSRPARGRSSRFGSRSAAR